MYVFVLAMLLFYCVNFLVLLRTVTSFCFLIDLYILTFIVNIFSFLSEIQEGLSSLCSLFKNRSKLKFLPLIWIVISSVLT